MEERGLAPAGVAVCVLVTVLAGACGPRPAAPALRTAHRVEYRLDWVWERATATSDGAAWEVVNDLGYRVRVTRGYVVSYSMELVECPKERTPISVGSLGRLPRSIFESTAFAGHASGTPNPAAIHPMQVESLTAPRARDAGTVTLAPQTYCQLHYLVGRASRDAAGLPPDLDMVDTSLHIDGTYVAPGASTTVPFVIHTAAAYGALFDHAAHMPAIRVDTGSNGARVVVRRHLGSIFDGVDFAQMRPPVMASQTLKALIDHVDVQIDLVSEDHRETLHQ